jgi:hypothetical protein
MQVSPTVEPISDRFAAAAVAQERMLLTLS